MILHANTWLLGEGGPCRRGCRWLLVDYELCRGASDFC